jgi:hypothetical protein
MMARNLGVSPPYCPEARLRLSDQVGSGIGGVGRLQEHGVASRSRAPRPRTRAQPGGAAGEAIQLHEVLLRHPWRVYARIIGRASSAAPIVALAGDVRSIAPDGIVLFHPPVVFFTDKDWGECRRLGRLVPCDCRASRGGGINTVRAIEIARNWPTFSFAGAQAGHGGARCDAPCAVGRAGRADETNQSLTLRALQAIRASHDPESGCCWTRRLCDALWSRARYDPGSRRLCDALWSRGPAFARWTLSAGLAQLSWCSALTCGACRTLRAGCALWSLRPAFARRACWALSTHFSLWSLRANWSRRPVCSLQALCALRALWSRWSRWSRWTLCPGLAAATRERERGHDERNAQQLSHLSLPAQGKRLPRPNRRGQARCSTQATPRHPRHSLARARTPSADRLGEERQWMLRLAWRQRG